jgi:nicotinamide-nucleotide amidase
MSVRAGILVTGTEVLTGRVSDRNGPWLAESLRQLGVDVGQIVVVGDRPQDLRAALAYLAAGHDLVITSGGLGPTADDLTAATVGDFQGRPAHLDEDLERRITVIVDRLVARFGGALDAQATAAGTRKQAMVPVGATVLEPTGTAPGLVVPAADHSDGPPVIVLPGPPRELQAMWPAAIEQAEVATIIAGAPQLRQTTLRLWGVPESELAAVLRRGGSALDGLEITTCLREGELEIVSRYRPDAEPAQQKLVTEVRGSFGEKLFSTGPTVDQIVASALNDRGWTLAVAEAALSGHTTARLAAALEGTEGRNRFLGGLVVQVPGARVPAEFTPSDDLTSPVAGQARSARAAFGADLGLGIAGPTGAEDGGAHVVIAVDSPAGLDITSFEVRGRAEFVRERASTLALHVLRRLLAQDPPG